MINRKQKRTENCKLVEWPQLGWLTGVTKHISHEQKKCCQGQRVIDHLIRAIKVNHTTKKQRRHNRMRKPAPEKMIKFLSHLDCTSDASWAQYWTENKLRNASIWWTQQNYNLMLVNMRMHLSRRREKRAQSTTNKQNTLKIHTHTKHWSKDFYKQQVSK